MQFTVLDNQNLTPLDNEKDVYLIRFSFSEPFDYAPGDWLTIQPENPPKLVAMVLECLNLNGSEQIEIRRVGTVTVQEALSRYVELTLLNPSILNKLQRQYEIGSWEDRTEMINYAEGRDIIDLLEAFPVFKEKPLEFLSILSPLAPRHYSIASAVEAVGKREVHLLYKHIRYHREGRDRFGAATTHLCELVQGDQISGRFVENKVFKLNEDKFPIIMVGAGTGSAPYISFLQQIEVLWPERMKDSWLFFGETYSKTCFLFEDHLNDWQKQGLNLFTAFSRDQENKVYVQDLLWEQRKIVWCLLEQGANFYLCGDKDQMAKDVEAVMLNILQEEGRIEHPESVWKEWKKDRTVQVDVY